jgi:hypothetical protein
MFLWLILTLTISAAAFAGEREGLQRYYNETARAVKEASDPAQKREILTTSLDRMGSALDALEKTPLLSAEDRAGIARYRAALREKQDELAGTNAFERVSDSDLNAFSVYMVQDMEQAGEYITISLVGALLILILIILLV